MNPNPPPCSPPLPALLLLAGLLPAAQAPVQRAPQPTAAPQTPPPAPAAPAQEPPKSVTITLDRGTQERKIKLAIPAFRGPASSPARRREPARRSRRRCGATSTPPATSTIQGAEALSGLALSGDVQKDLPVYRSTGNEVLLLGDVRAEGDHIVLEGRVLDLGSGQAVLAKRYRGPFPVSRRMAHTFADEVVRFLVGKPGIALSSDRLHLGPHRGTRRSS